MLAVSVITPSRSRRTASYWSRVITLLLLGCPIGRSPVSNALTKRATARTARLVWQRPERILPLIRAWRGHLIRSARSSWGKARSRSAQQYIAVIAEDTQG